MRPNDFMDRGSSAWDSTNHNMRLARPWAKRAWFIDLLICNQTLAGSTFVTRKTFELYVNSLHASLAVINLPAWHSMHRTDPLPVL